LRRQSTVAGVCPLATHKGGRPAAPRLLSRARDPRPQPTVDGWATEVSDDSGGAPVHCSWGPCPLTPGWEAVLPFLFLLLPLFFFFFFFFFFSFPFFLFFPSSHS